MQQRIMAMRDAQIRSDQDGKYLDGYFAVFDQPYEVCPGWVETIAPGAFSRWLATGKDTKVLWNHDHSIVLGSTANGTATLREDAVGLFGSVLLNPQDQDAVNAYARVGRGDVTGCSFGFDIARMEESWEDDGTYRTRILEVNPLFEVSPCTFPAYGGTSISARAKEDLERAMNTRKNAWRDKMLARLKACK